MSMMMPPDPGAAPNLPVAPGGMDAGGPPPMDSLAGQGLPSGGGVAGLMAALGGGGGPPGMELGGGPPGPPEGEDFGSDDEPMDAIGHIQVAMKHLMMAIAKDDDDERGLGITKGMGALQGILAGEQKKNSQLSALGGG